MWTRKELKEKGNRRFKANYWKAVLAALVLGIIMGNTPQITQRYDAEDIQNMGLHGVTESFEDLQEEFADLAEDGTANITPEKMESIVKRIEKSASAAKIFPILILIGTIGMAAAAAGICLKIFLLNPLALGGQKFFLSNLKQDGEIGEIGAGFCFNYIGNVKTLFLRDLFTVLWSLLFVIPGIIKAYEYRMIPYLIAENPDMSTNEAFEKSKAMMRGNKWEAFVLDLSFLGWFILSGITLGILGIFYVNPYVYSTNAALYEKLSEIGRTVEVYDHYVEVE